jgi:hypothetical protein
MARKKTSPKQNNSDRTAAAERKDAVIVERNAEAYSAMDETAESHSPKNDSRQAPRTVTDLKTIVQFHIGQDETWKEVTRVSTVSKSGASFTLSHHCDVGRLVTLVMPLAPEFRAYDFTEDLYPVIGLVQYCYPSAGSGDDRSYSVGVAFVGKTFPDGHKENPTQNYHISGTTSTGMWQIKPSGATFKVRSAPRFWVPLEVTVSQIKRDRSATDYKEQTVTSNVSTSGASVPCSLDLEIGDRIKFASKEHDFYTIGIVRNRQVKGGKKPVLHIEFVDNRFPVEKIAVPSVTAVTA